MDKQKIENAELKDLMNFISSKYSKEEIDWYLSLAPQSVTDNKVEIKVSSNSYADQK